MKKKLIISTVVLLITSGIALACYKTKQCCKRDYRGMTCITKCDYEFCPFNYPIEIK